MTIRLCALVDLMAQVLRSQRHEIARLQVCLAAACDERDNLYTQLKEAKGAASQEKRYHTALITISHQDIALSAKNAQHLALEASDNPS